MVSLKTRLTRAGKVTFVGESNFLCWKVSSSSTFHSKFFAQYFLNKIIIIKTTFFGLYQVSLSGEAARDPIDHNLLRIAVWIL